MPHDAAAPARGLPSLQASAVVALCCFVLHFACRCLSSGVVYGYSDPQPTSLLQLDLHRKLRACLPIVAPLQMEEGYEGSRAREAGQVAST